VNTAIPQGSVPDLVAPPDSPVPEWHPQYWKVVNVAANDTLSLHESSSQTSRLVARIPADHQRLLFDGKEKLNGPDRWMKVRVDGYIGYVNAKYLAPVDDPSGFRSPVPAPVPASTFVTDTYLPPPPAPRISFYRIPDLKDLVGKRLVNARLYGTFA